MAISTARACGSTARSAWRRADCAAARIEHAAGVQALLERRRRRALSRFLGPLCRERDAAAPIAEYRPRAEAALSFVDNTVKDQPFLVGDYCTIADIGCWGRMVFMAEGGFDIDNWPYLAAWAGRLRAMPGFALPYELARAWIVSSTRRS